MGKQTSILTIAGRVGNVVGYSFRNSLGLKTDGLRAVASSVKNPQSYGQARQRLRLRPLNNFYRQLRDIVRRAYQSTSYGDLSLRQFRKLNMTDFQGPYLTKGDYSAVPGPFKLSLGSLVPINVTDVSASFATTDLSVGDFTNLGSLSASLIASNTDIREGDQLSFIGCFMVNNTAPSFVYRVQSFVVDASSTDAVPLTISSTGADGDLTFTIGLRSDETMVAGAVIQSRDGEGVHLRSSSTMAINQTALAGYFGADALAAAVASYQTEASSVDWPTEQLTRNGATFDIGNPIVIGGETYYGIANIDAAHAGLVKGDGSVVPVFNNDMKSANFEKWLAPSTILPSWSTVAPSDVTGKVDITEDNIYEVGQWALNFGYTVRGFFVG